MRETDRAFYALEVTIAKAIQVSCVTAFFYYCALNFTKEKDYIWSRNWSAGKAMYLLTRYSGAAFLVLVIVSIFKLAWNDVGILQDDSESTWMAYDRSADLCLLGYLYIGPGPFIILFAEIILQMRVYALYGRKKRILFLMILLSSISLGVDIVQAFGIAYMVTEKICVGKACDLFKRRSLIARAPPVYPCTTSSLPISSAGWLVTSLVEFILFIMVLRKTRQANENRVVSSSTPGSMSRAYSHDIPAVMARDSATYFAIIFTICFIGVCLSFITQIETDSSFLAFIASQMNAYQTMVLAIMTLLAPNLLINLRMEYYGSSEVTSLATWNVARPGLEDTHEDAEFDPNAGVRESLLLSHERTHSQRLEVQLSHHSGYDGILTEADVVIV